MIMRNLICIHNLKFTNVSFQRQTCYVHGVIVGRKKMPEDDHRIVETNNQALGIR